MDILANDEHNLSAILASAIGNCIWPNCSKDANWMSNSSETAPWITTTWKSLNLMPSEESGMAGASGHSTHIRPFMLVFWQKTVWQCLFAILVGAAIIGNAVVMWIILAHREMRTTKNYFLFNLSLADFMMATFNAIFNFIYMLDSHWPFGSIYCTVNNFISSLSVASSVFTMVAMTFDRYMIIVKPLNPRMSKTKATTLTFIIWFSSCIISFPTLFYSVTKTWTYKDGDFRTLCLLWWPDGPATTSRMNYIYDIIFLAVTYLLPMMAMIFGYTIMCHELWSQKGIGELTSRQLHSIKCKRRVVKMFITVVITFAICWLPYHIIFIYSYHDSRLVHSHYIQNIFLGFYWLAMSNAIYNPLVYYCMNGRFRMYFKTIFCCWKKLRYLPLVNGSFRWSRSDSNSAKNRRRLPPPDARLELRQKNTEGSNQNDNNKHQSSSKIFFWIKSKPHASGSDLV